MERSPGALRAPFLVQCVGDHQGAGVDLQDRAQGRSTAIERLDPIQVQLDELTSGQLFRSHQLLQIGNGGFLDYIIQQLTPDSGNPRCSYLTRQPWPPLRRCAPRYAGL